MYANKMEFYWRLSYIFVFWIEYHEYMSKRDNIIFIKKGNQSFFHQDIEILSKDYEVTVWDFKRTDKLAIIISLLEQLFVLPFQLMKAKTVFIWFADYHAFLPVFFAKLLNIQSIVVVGGYDATFIPELNYGAYSKGLRSLLTKKIVQWASWVIPVDDSLSDKITSRNGALKSVKTVYTGHDSKKWFCDTEKVNRIVTVGAFDNVSRLKIKGLDFFVEVAKRLPQYEFAIVRAMNNKGHLLGELPANLTLFTKRLSDEELRQLLSSSKIYAQFSLSEGLPSATTRADRGFKYRLKRRMVPPFPAASRPSKIITTRFLFFCNQFCNLSSSNCNFSNSLYADKNRKGNCLARFTFSASPKVCATFLICVALTSACKILRKFLIMAM